MGTESFLEFGSVNRYVANRKKLIKPIQESMSEKILEPAEDYKESRGTWDGCQPILKM